MPYPLVVIILAAGEGKRMRSDLPKVLHPCGEKPMLVRVIETVQSLHPQKIVVVAGRHHPLILETLEKWIDCQEIVFVKQPTPMGTGHAVRCCENEFESNDRVLIINGDMPLIRHGLLEDLLEKARHVEGTVLTAILENPYGYGRIIYHPTGIFTGIIEEKDCSLEQKQIQEINTGVYVFHGKVLHHCLSHITNNNQQQEYYLTDIIKFTNKYTINTFLIDKNENIQICGVNTPEELHELSKYT